MAEDAGGIRSAELMDSIGRSIDQLESTPQTNEPDGTGVDTQSRAIRYRKIITSMAIVGLIIGIIGLNFMAYMPPTTTLNDFVGVSYPVEDVRIFSTYYTGDYEICTAEQSIETTKGKIEERPKQCWTGNMHATIVFKSVALDHYSRVYLILALEKMGRKDEINAWKKLNRGRESGNRFYMGFSGIEATKMLEKLSFVGLSPSISPYALKGPQTKFWPIEAFLQQSWNSFGMEEIGPVCSFKVNINQPVPSRNQISYREVDDFYMANIRRYSLNDYAEYAGFSISRLNPFNAFKKDMEPSVAYNGDIVLEEGNNVMPITPKHADPQEKTVEGVTGVLKSPDCGVSMTFSGHERDMSIFEKLLFRFSTTYIIKSIIECAVLFYQLKVVDATSKGKTISIMTLCMLCYQDMLEIFWLVYHGSAFQYALLSFGLMVFVKFFLVAVIEHSFLVLVWRANHSAQIREGWVATQKRFILFYRYCFSFMILQGLLWYFFYQPSPWVCVFSYLCWVPQILLDAWRGHCSAFHILTIVATTACRLYLPIYIFFVREGVFNYDVFVSDISRRNAFVGATIVLSSILQIFLMSLQRLHGARYFASWSILPQIYNYVRPWSKMMEDDPQECVICMYDIVQSKRDWSITPCDHLFHTNCLREWTSIKPECPNCRAPLPPVT